MRLKFNSKQKLNLLTNLLLFFMMFMTLLSFIAMKLFEPKIEEVTPIKTELYESSVDASYDGSEKPLLIVSGEYEPYIYTENGVIKGFEYEMMKKVLDEMGVKYGIQMMSWPRGLYLMDIGEAFGTFPYSPTPERIEKYFLTDSLINAEKRRDYFYGYTRNGEVIKVNSLDDLNHYKVGAIEGYYYTALFDKNEIAYDLSNDEQECFNKLKEGRIDLFPMNPLVAKAIIDRYFNGDPNFEQLDFSIAVDNPADCLMVNKGDPRAEAFVLYFNQIFYRLRSTDEMKSYYECDFSN